MSTKLKTSYSTVLEASLEDAERFWSEAAKDLHWTRPWDKVLDESAAPYYRWVTGGE